MKGMIKKIGTKIVSILSGEINSKSFWYYREKIEKRNRTILFPWYYIKYQKLLSKSGASIPLATKFESKPYFPHGLFGIFISVGAHIGKECVIFHQVTIGSNTTKGSKRMGAPTIGNNCYIGVGAKIIGKVKVGNNVRIGANCIVVEDIPDNCTVVQNKPRIIKKNGNDNSWVPFNNL